ncbi:MAG: Alanine racemase [Patescibacteria group bacterium]|nr:Alanine racemase [Patescibacteria group bacterium]
MKQNLTWLEIDARAINYNLSQFRKLIGPKRLLMPVLKSNAYGHGFLEIARICERNKKVDRICVVNLEEALILIKAKIKKPILILSFYELNSEKIALALKNQVIFSVSNLLQAKFLNKIAQQIHQTVKIEIEIDTGASRTGVLASQALPFVQQLKKLPHLEIKGVWSHFASSEDDPRYTKFQLATFQKVVSELENQEISFSLKHFACSASSLLYPNTLFNGIRLGLSLYGLYPSEAARKKLKLKPALSWYTRVIDLKTLPKNTKIGYGGTYTTTKKTKLAIIPVGYWDGYDRHLSNKSTVIINNKKCPVRGRICMNLTMVDVSQVKNIRLGDQVILIGHSQTQKITVEELAQLIGTINYEVVTRINPLLPRIVKNY